MKFNLGQLVKFTPHSTAQCCEISTDNKSEIQKDSPVCSHTEWDPLEEVILGRPDGACYSDLNIDMKVIQQTPNAASMLVKCWASVVDPGSTLNQHRVNVPYNPVK